MTEPARPEQAPAYLFGGVPMADQDHDPRDVYDQGRRDAFAEAEAWLKTRRDRYTINDGNARSTLTDALEDLREHMHTGTPLAVPVRRHEEGRQ